VGNHPFIARPFEFNIGALNMLPLPGISLLGLLLISLVNLLLLGLFIVA